MSKPPGDYQPSRREVLRPAEYVGGAAIAAIFVGVITLGVTRDLVLAAIGTGGVFIIVLVVLALLAMTIKPDAAESAELDDDAAARAERDGDAPTGDAPGTPEAPRAH
ncbi:hypothetical protein SAMN05428970_0161 [Agromyces sp. CF514]|uniref:hypothetical protein n=1 Tax=Agromyces sp. CF514 TaxID=1881031 RepID=UPI0008F03C93|nr:hypothetical protein [Agromyces sp. CF514]SFR67155.1 hypothetical protein SAMN05428970_0161 [Agromyces sp. CF514]